MENICDKDLCSGCGACVSSCPKQCIELTTDKYGCLYPNINNNDCINCGLCQKVCIQNNCPTKYFPQKTFAAYLKNFNERLDSASGGIAKSLYNHWLKQENSYIVGVYFDENMQARYLVTNNQEYIHKFQGSKYVQAYTDEIYKQVELLLKKENKVLFVGMPCQVAALLNYITSKNIKTENLTTVDILCHGVSPHQYLDEQLDYLRKKRKLKNFKKLSFRSNRKFKNFHFVADETNDYAYENPYFYAFLKGVSLRESCFNCQFSTKERIADITIGDFIGLANDIPFEGNKINASLILCNTPKGENTVKQLSDLHLFERKLDEAYKGGASLQAPFTKHKYREAFLNKYQKGQFVQTIWKIAFWDLFQYALKVSYKKIWVNLFKRDLLK